MAEQRMFHYDAFISYRHAEIDKAAAVGLHRRLESFRMPAGLRTDLPEEKRRIQRVFRDQDELPLSSNLSDAIENALRNTDWLIVIATPRFPQSKWCAKEIERFTELYGQDRILVVLADGTPEESIPEVLRFRQNGAVDEIIADVRGKNSLDEAALRIAARMYDLDPEELKQRVRERRVKRIAAVSAFLAAVLLVFAMYCASQFTRISAQNTVIEAQNAELQEQYEVQKKKYQDSMAATARRLAGLGRRRDALYAVCSALDYAPGGDTVGQAGINAALQERLASLTGVYDRNALVLEDIVEMPPLEDESFWQPDRREELQEEYEWLEYYLPTSVIWNWDISELEDGKLLFAEVGTEEFNLYLFDPEQGFLDDVAVLWFSDPPTMPVETALYRDGKFYLGVRSLERDQLVCYTWKSTEGYEKAGEIQRKEILQEQLLKVENGQEKLSGDGRYRISPQRDFSLRIYEGDQETPARILYELEGIQNGIFAMEPLEGTDLYVIIGDTLHSWLLNRDLEIIARIPGYFGYDPERRALIQWEAPKDLNTDVYTLFYCPLRSEKELIEEAEKILGDYTPSGKTLERFRIQSGR